MILGIGTDICSISRIEKIYNKYTIKFANKICNESVNANQIAKKWAATEALSKAISLGLGKTQFKNVTVAHETNGKPYFILTSILEEKIKKLHKIKTFKTHLSLSDDGIYIIAMVILEA